MKAKSKKHSVSKLIGGLFYTVFIILFLNVQSLAKENLSETDHRITWLKKNAVSLKSIDPNDEDFSDMEPLAKAIGNARIVQLGEQTHGDGATFYAKIRLIKFLHQKLGFDVLAFESGLYDCHKAWELLLSGTEPYEAFRNGVFGVWGISEQVRPLIEYWGRTARSNRPLELCGFDCQFTARASRDLLHEDVNNLFNKLSTDALSSKQRIYILETLTKLSDLQQKPRDPNQEERELLQGGLLLWGKALDYAKPSVVLPENELAFWRQFVASTTILAAMVSEPNDEGNLRDQQMARNLVWFARTAFPNRKIIVWAASSHITRNPPSDWNMTSMGNEVWKELGKSVYTIGFTAAEGWWKAAHLRIGVRLEAPAAGSIEDIFMQAGLENAFVDFRNLDSDGAWLKEKLIARPFGYENREANWTERFDAFIFTRNMTGSTLPGQRVIVNAPIFTAVGLNDVDWVKSLLDAGVDVNVKTGTGDTPLSYAATDGYMSIAEMLITKGADVNMKNNAGQSILHLACKRGNKEIAWLLIDNKADIEAQNNNGMTPLHLAARNGQKEIVEFLIAKGADMNIKNKAGLTPLDLAQNAGQTEIVELLKQHGVKK